MRKTDRTLTLWTADPVGQLPSGQGSLAFANDDEPRLRVEVLWRCGDTVVVDPRPEAESHGVRLCRIVEGSGAQYGKRAIVYEREFGVYERGVEVRRERRTVAEVLWYGVGSGGGAPSWPGPEVHSCHTTSKGHPWNDGEPKPGHHRCSACGCFAWVECHGVADGLCYHCGHSG